jgi:ADP-ribose pyrophosphatase
MEIWLAEELEDGETRYDEDEHIEVVRVPFAQAMEWMVSGEIRDAKTLVGLWMAHQRGARDRPRAGGR